MINSGAISFKKIPFIKRMDAYTFDDYKVKTPSNNDYIVHLKNYPPTECYDIFVKNAKDEALGGSSYLLSQKQKQINDVVMSVKYNGNKNKGIGTVLHLSHIMEMLENNLDAVKFYSIKDAVFFHSKLGFKPDIDNFFDLETVLYFLESNKSPGLQLFSEKAARLRNEIRLCLKENFIRNENSDIDKKLTVETKIFDEGNCLIDRYIKVCEKLSSQESVFKTGFRMVLTREDVLKNRDFYNALFKKFDIDYQI